MMSSRTRLKIVAKLPPRASALLADIENWSGRSVQFAPNPRPLSALDPNPFAAACELDETNATIFYRDVNALSDNGIVHELLHIHRYWVEGIPQLVPISADERHWKLTSEIEGALEHLIIVPRELDFCPNRPGYWAETARNNWGRYPWPDVEDTWVRRKFCLLGRLNIEFVDEPVVRNFVKECLKREGMFGQAQQFARDIRRKMRLSKVQALIRTVDQLDMPLNKLKLLYIDPRTGTVRHENLCAKIQ